MATWRESFDVPASAATVWAAVRDFGAVDRLAAGFVTHCSREEGGAVRRLVFFNGLEARERLVTLEDDLRRLAYTVEGGRATHYHAEVVVADNGAGGARFTWTVDLLPDALAPAIAQMMRKGAQAMQAALTPAAR